MFRKGKRTETEVDTIEEGHQDDGTVQPLTPNRTFYIVPHSGFTKTINVLEITELIKADYPSEQFEKQAKDIATNTPPQPWLTITRTPRWYSKNFVVKKQGEKSGEIAQWKAGMFSSSSNTFTFPADSPHSSHPIKIVAENTFRFREQFIKDSVTYLWKPENGILARKFTLFKIIGTQKQIVGKYWQGWQLKHGGTLVLNTHEIDEVVAVMSMVSILRKKRQKDAEHGGGGGGG
jgi:hypothetical protein